MIFISHNYKDKDFIGPIAESLSIRYGREKIFFDSWSIKPGDNIIGQMNTGIEKCKVFFFFITEDSLKSDMVKLEWTSAIMKQARNPDMKFIPIRADNVNVPSIISSINYLDLVNNGLEITLSQMIEIIDDEYKEKQFPEFINIQAYALPINTKTVKFYISSKRFFEPSSKFLFFTMAEENQIKIEVNNFNMFEYRFNPNSATLDSENLNSILIGVQGGIKKGFYIEITVEALVENFRILNLYHVKSENEFPLIPVKIINDISEIK